MLSRYTILRKDFELAKKFLDKSQKTLKKDTPNWVVKNAQFLQIENGEVRYNNLPIVPKSEVNSFLRKLIFDKGKKVLSLSRWNVPLD